MSKKETILNSLKNKNLVKVIAGINNYNKQKVLDVSIAAELGGAQSVDICDNKEIIEMVSASVEIPIFVSSVSAQKLIESQNYGATVLEIGNFESFYLDGKMFTPDEILQTAISVKQSINKNTLLCCTVPATLETENQIKLSERLLNIGVDILQTEGFSPQVPTSDRADLAYLDILKAASTLTNTKVLSKEFPEAMIITASGITPTTIPFAIAMGASGVGVGTFINTLPNQTYMVSKVKELLNGINSFSPKYLEMERLLSLSV